MKKFYVYTNATGEITRYGSAPEPLSDQQGPGETAVEGDVEIETQYVLDGALVDRPTIPTPEGTSYDLTLLPAGTVVEVFNESNESLTITDLTEPLTLDNAGIYRFYVMPPFPYQPVRCTIEVA